MSRTNKGGFTLIEIVIAVIVLAILAAFTLPTIHTLREDAKRSVVKEALKQMRGDIAAWYVKGVSSGDAKFPTLEELTNSIMPSGVPVNPYNNKKTVASGMKESRNDSAGWVYNPKTGEIYSAAAETQGAGF